MVSGLNQKYGYIIVNANGLPILVDAQMPIYWKKKVAIEESKKWGNCTVQKVWILSQDEMLR